MTHHLCIPPDVFESIVQAYPFAVVEADESRQYLTLGGVEFSTPLRKLGAA